MRPLREEFQACAERVSCGGIGAISQSTQLQLYAFYSIATKGDPPDRGPSPLLDPRGSAKWTAWNAQRGTSVYAIAGAVHARPPRPESLEHAYP